VPKYLLTNAKITINGVDLSRFGFSLDTPDEREQVDVSGFNPAGTREYLPGQRNQSIVVGFLQGFGTGEPHRVLQPLYEGGSVFTISIQADATASPGPGNPTFGGSASLYSYDGLNGQLNARGEVTATFLAASGGGFQWGTA
jgi:hypothetical protein